MNIMLMPRKTLFLTALWCGWGCVLVWRRWLRGSGVRLFLCFLVFFWLLLRFFFDPGVLAEEFGSILWRLALSAELGLEELIENLVKLGAALYTKRIQLGDG